MGVWDSTHTHTHTSTHRAGGGDSDRTQMTLHCVFSKQPPKDRLQSTHPEDTILSLSCVSVCALACVLAHVYRHVMGKACFVGQTQAGRQRRQQGCSRTGVHDRQFKNYVSKCQTSVMAGRWGGEGSGDRALHHSVIA